MKKIKLALWIFPLFFSQAFGMQFKDEESGEQRAANLQETIIKQLIGTSTLTPEELKNLKERNREIQLAFKQAIKRGDKDSIEKSKKDFSNLIDNWVSLEDLLTS